jgi:soluble lytic murein transglycosylase-like protein
MPRASFCSAALILAWMNWTAYSGHPAQFTPRHQLAGIGAGRAEMSGELLAERTRLMIQSQTFGILRDPRAEAGAARIYSRRMQDIFRTAARISGLPASLIAAVSYLESWGDSRAQSPTGPKGAMQISAATGRAMGLRMIYATRYRTTVYRKRVRTRRGRLVMRRVRQRIPYSVLLRDERLVPERAIPAAASYLARLSVKFGGLDWAIFAYHCGEGCAATMQALTEQAKGVSPPYTVAKMFFAASPALNRKLYEAINDEMDRDFSPTYWFRVMRAEQLLELYREDRPAFEELAGEYRYAANSAKRAPDRLALWLQSKDLQFRSSDDLKRERGNALAAAFDDPEFFGYSLEKERIAASDPANEEYYLEASPSAIGTLVYVAYETRRLWQAMQPGEKYVPLPVTALVRPLDDLRRTASAAPGAVLAHASGQVFDIDYRDLPPDERRALEFVLDDMGWEGYVGFVAEPPNGGTLHIGSAPSARPFFRQVFDDALAATRETDLGAAPPMSSSTAAHD